MEIIEIKAGRGVTLLFSFSFLIIIIFFFFLFSFALNLDTLINKVYKLSTILIFLFFFVSLILKRIGNQ